MEANLFLAIFFTVLAASLFVIYAVIKLTRRIWTGRDKWRVTSSYPSIAYENNPDNIKDKRREWRSSNPQAVEQWFRIDLGKEKMIASIEFDTDKDWIEKPDKWLMEFHTANQNVTVGRPVTGRGFIQVASKDLPEHFRYLTVYITEEAKDMPEGSNYTKRYGKKVYWTISNVKIRQYIFNFGVRKWLTYEL